MEEIPAMGDPEMFESAYEMLESAFRKSRHSVAQGACVEVGWRLPGVVVIRDSQNVDGARVPVAPNAWRRFISEVKLKDRT
jgi:Domain of unknown function (DUF397)